MDDYPEDLFDDEEISGVNLKDSSQEEELAEPISS